MESQTCLHADNLLQLAMCVIEHYWPLRVQKESSVDLPLMEEEVFFMAKAPRASTEYTLHVSKHSKNLTDLSIRPPRGVFLLLFGAACGLSYLIIQYLIMEREEILRLYWRELLGYLLVSGVVSLLVCYRQSAVTSRHTLSVMTWVLQVVGVALACHGVTYAPVSWILLTLLLGVKILPLLLTLILPVWGQVCWLLWTFLGLFQRRSSCRRGLLTEEEYRKQAERHTRASLEELRRYCRNPSFPAWDTVLRLRAPHRFAEFLQSGAHVTASETQSHELHKHSGFGSECTENTLPTHIRADSTDFSDGEIDTHTSNLNSFSSSPPLPISPALHSPAAYTAPICPYPPIQYMPTSYPSSAPERPLTDEDEPF
ncbi:Nuclear envelope integral membrane protein 1 [Bagarius yarrelli]|uniref:Nuclear envelope integral membrane protein 1 n=1 Tax=Bagarius yarrelli TaxID=175774 RepID=A0A556VX25_BAGYA|nr:Nuclear envelope integral membrane protein 1 [Bagarius yarrelli]